MGFLICDITVTGKSAYFGVPELGVDALKAGHAVLSALWAHSAALERLAPHPLVGRPFLLVTEVKAGGYIAVPGECRISLILKLIPGQSLDEAKAGLEAAARSAPLAPGIRLAFDYPAGRDHPVGGTPTETPEATPFVRQLVDAVRSRASRPGRDRRRALLVRGAVPRRPGSASRRSIGRRATSATATRSRSASSSGNISTASSPSRRSSPPSPKADVQRLTAARTSGRFTEGVAP